MSTETTYLSLIVEPLYFFFLQFELFEQLSVLISKRLLLLLLCLLQSLLQSLNV